ncbi:P-loop containing nucleoside triphosphate hydrolase [Fusarium albosuccineum]|uniref:P-loop containing nucleoside triphosphate hydrolase n=1 Tax=Fusarium albosuccineum TaxID=1237068 RepID=A0A8H4LFB4_9HYPO|nr:P-loop containing nucleoside triphosphate hydrolase [Fusarium albosuccineum]
MDLEDGDPDALKTLLDDCYESTEKLKTIFLKIVHSKDRGFPQVYQALMANIGKKGLVESLISKILRDMATLASYRVFQTATQHQVEELKIAIKEINQVNPSLPDSAFKEKSTSNTHFSQGPITNLYNGSEQNMDKAYLTALRVTDPRDDKNRIEETKGGLLPDSYK